MKRRAFPARALLSAALLLAACESQYDPNADVSARPRECPAGVEYRSCTRPGSCVEWGYPPERVGEIDDAGGDDCSISDGEWSSEPCAQDRYEAGCRNVWVASCATVWISAAVIDHAERQRTCELYLGGVWLQSVVP